jgi:hypothetical protein
VNKTTEYVFLSSEGTALAAIQLVSVRQRIDIAVMAYGGQNNFKKLS